MKGQNRHKMVKWWKSGQMTIENERKLIRRGRKDIEIWKKWERIIWMRCCKELKWSEKG